MLLLYIILLKDNLSYFMFIFFLSYKSKFIITNILLYKILL